MVGLPPTCGPIRFTAAFNDNDESSDIASPASPTSRCALSRNSSGHFLGAGMTPLFGESGLHDTRRGSNPDGA